MGAPAPPAVARLQTDCGLPRIATEAPTARLPMRVRDVMTYGAIGVPETATLAEAIETLLRARVSALFVFDADHALVGVLSEGDLLRRAELGTDRKRPRWLEFLLERRAARRVLRPHARPQGRRDHDRESGDASPRTPISARRST